MHVHEENGGGGGKNKIKKESSSMLIFILCTVPRSLHTLYLNLRDNECESVRLFCFFLEPAAKREVPVIVRFAPQISYKYRDNPETRAFSLVFNLQVLRFD